MRALRILLVFLVIFAVLFVAADRIALKLAEDEAAERVRSAQGVAEAGDASVDVQGFPFLTQVFAKELDQVDVTLDGLTAQAGDREVTVTKIDAQLRHVKLENNYSSAVAQDATGTALISYADLSKAADEGVKVGWGGKNAKGEGQVEVTAGVTLLGRSFERSVHSTVSLKDGDTVKLHAEKVPGDGIPGVEDAIRKKIDFDRTISGLPKGLELNRVEATKKGIVLGVKGTGVELGG
ncbi:LmeA family phospholipid-binding protein [Streptomyces daliensis]|uniref:DUF2993 domain-containing protein n=1 Tax=Streptomyces daliensis TaxID=299421 RepID=A0A8T4IQ59_9ACTN|nr:DUF2993 domain-containing protein [Streptomyces daliensis]